MFVSQVNVKPSSAAEPAFACKAGTFEPSTSTGNQVIDGLGFTPKIVLFFANADSSSPRSAAHAAFAFGAAVSSSSRFCVAGDSQDNIGTSQCVRTASNTHCIRPWLYTAAAPYEIDFVSMNADGFTVNIESAPVSTGHDVHYLALGGTDLQAAIKQFATPTGTGDQATDSVGFQPDAMILVNPSVRTIDSLPAAKNGSNLGIGACTATSEAAIAIVDKDNVSVTQADRTYRSAKVATTADAKGEADLTSFDADGFTLNWTEADSLTRHIWAICLEGVQFAVGTETQQTSATTKATNGVGFQPECLLLFSHNSSTDGDAADLGLSVGASDGTNEASISAASDDGLSAASNASRRSETSSAIAMVAEGEDETLGEATVDSFDVDGFTLDWTVADGTARQFGYLAIAGN